jgi:hypothetical protein
VSADRRSDVTTVVVPVICAGARPAHRVEVRHHDRLVLCSRRESMTRTTDAADLHELQFELQSGGVQESLQPSTQAPDLYR